MYSNADFLFSRPSFIEGLGRIVDVSGALNQYNVMPSAHLADAWAMWLDWSAVGGDLGQAAGQFKAEHKAELTCGKQQKN